MFWAEKGQWNARIIPPMQSSTSRITAAGISQRLEVGDFAVGDIDFAALI